MTDIQVQILLRITSYLEEHPDQRFGQAIFNLGINEFEPSPKIVSLTPEYRFRDNYNDSDERILERIKKILNFN